jgi:hypothetical protein
MDLLRFRGDNPITVYTCVAPTRCDGDMVAQREFVILILIARSEGQRGVFRVNG